jgi:hypothetical protein
MATKPPESEALVIGFADKLCKKFYAGVKASEKHTR